jgi:hypothetical protein
MTLKLSGDERRAARERCDAATDGPWEAWDGPGIHAVDAADCRIVHEGLDPGCLPRTHARQKRDGVFIAHARTDLPAALDDIETLEGVLRAVIATADEVGRSSPNRNHHGEKLLDYYEALRVARALLADGPTP